MEGFRRCPRCSQYMTPYLHYGFDVSYTVWTCTCGYFENGTKTITGTATTNMGGGASDRTVDRKNR